jgi:hypothetical protein
MLGTICLWIVILLMKIFKRNMYVKLVKFIGKYLCGFVYNLISFDICRHFYNR